MAVFDQKAMTLTEGGYPNYAWVESVQYADEAGGERLVGKYDEKQMEVVGPESCECVPANACTTYVPTPTREGFDDEPTCDPSLPKSITCPIGQVCQGKGASSYCDIPNAYQNCAITYDGATPPTTATCGSLDYDSQAWKASKCSAKDQCKWMLKSGIGNPQTPADLIACSSKAQSDPSKCAIPWSVSFKDPAQTQSVRVTTTMYYPQPGYGRFTNYGKTGIYYSKCVCASDNT